MIVDLWNALLRWARSPEGWAIITGVILPFVAIIASGLIAALIARSGIGRLLHRQRTEARSAAIAGLLAVARRATLWTTLSAQEKDQIDYQITESIVRLRLAENPGAPLAAEWAQLRLASIKRQSATMLAQAEIELADLENGLIEWHRRPKRAKKIFGNDLTWLRADDNQLDKDLLAKQKQWLSDQHASQLRADTPASHEPGVSSSPAGLYAGGVDDILAGTAAVPSGR